MSESEEYNWIGYREFINSLSKGDVISIWSDGGCNPNPGPGGWGAVLEHGNDRTILNGGGTDTTNNRMEMIAALTSIDGLPSGCKITLYSDSQYVIKGISQWMWGWKKRSWRKSDDTEITNVDLWKEIYTAVTRHKVKCVWVKGHNGHPENELCDYLATQARITLDDSQRSEKYATATLSQSMGG